MRSPFRAAAPAPAWRNVTKTLLQTALFWLVFLVALPAAIVRFEDVPAFDFPGRRAGAAATFLAASALGIWSGATMARRGQGTPLPLDCPRRLVVAGPYAHVRNPMAIAGLAQGAAVGAWLGSWLVPAYVAAGFVVWNWGVRRIEERDLERRFGAEFEAYRAAVRCWLPRRRPYGGP